MVAYLPYSKSPTMLLKSATLRLDPLNPTPQIVTLCHTYLTYHF